MALDGPNYLFFCSTGSCMQDDEDYGKANASHERRESEINSKKNEEFKQRDILRNKFGSMFLDASLSNSTLSSGDLQDVMNWIESERDFFVYSGIPGCGKTFLSAAIYHWLLKKEVDVEYLHCKALYKELHRAIQNNMNNDDIIKKYQYKKFLLLDDIGSTQNTEWQKEVMLDLIDYRYEHQLPTMITTNFKYDDMRIYMGERLATRVFSKESLVLEDWENCHRRPGDY